MSKLIPSERQLAFQDWEFGAFFHFGIRSFFLGHRDWDNRPMPAEAYNPDQLDCGQWIRTVREAGATYAILVCKHHDGFANWPSAYSDYSVKYATWKNGQGDMVREFTNACRQYGLKVGLYYSPAQWGGTTKFSEAKEYDDYFINQISELLTNYGKIDYLWFDGCGSENHEYDKPRIIKTIRSLQPDILIFEMWDPDTRWVGNEDGYADMDNPSTRTDLDFSMLAASKKVLDHAAFLPAECDCMLRDTWFDCELNEDKIKQVDELMGMYEMSVGRGANFLLNIGPNCHGLLNDADVERVKAFGEKLRQRYGSPLTGFGSMQKTGEKEWSIMSPDFEPKRGTNAENHLVNRVVLMEDLTNGEAVKSFRLYANLPAYRSKRICIYKGDTIGHKAICTFPTMNTACLTLEITGADGEVTMRDMKAYYSE